jgi:hypothetical protein
MIPHYIKHHMTSSNSPLVMAMKLKAKGNFHMSAIWLF